MENGNLNVIRGGLSDTILTSKKEFLDCYATNTRLMGVTCVHAIYMLPQNFNLKIAHLFFYFDSEDFNFDTYERVLATSLDDPKALPIIEEIKNKMMGGLGGTIVRITEKEFHGLFTYYYEKTLKCHDDLPEGYDEYSFLVDKKVYLNREELFNLYDKICEPLTTDNQVVHYYLMRSVGNDYDVASYLTNGMVLRDRPLFKHGSMLRNRISEIGSDMNLKNDDSYYSSFSVVKTYFSETLVDDGSSYYIETSRATVENHKITSFKRLKCFEITETEAKFQTLKPEYITLYELSFSPELVLNLETPLMKFSMDNMHENGIVYMIFNPNNDHVKKDIFNLNDDVLGVYYLTRFGQILLMAYDKEGLRKLKRDFQKSKLYSNLTKLDDYEFSFPVLYDFVESPYEDFRDYIDMEY